MRAEGLPHGCDIVILHGFASPGDLHPRLAERDAYVFCGIGFGEDAGPVGCGGGGEGGEEGGLDA